MVDRSRGSVWSPMRMIACLGGLLSALSAFSVEAATGRTAGSFEVTDQGSAAYSISLFTPPGPRGMQPSIALVYNSSSHVGYMGRGWSITGFSSISRCPRTVAQDGAAAPVGHYLSDGYCMDGNRLRVQSGTYGQGGSTYLTEFADFSRIGAVGTSGYGPTSWTVERKDGLTYTYGGTSDSRVMAGATVSRWMVNLIEDRAGNKIVFHWKAADGSTFGTTHPTKIEWTQTSAHSGSYLYSMDFHYAAAGNSPASSRYEFSGSSLALEADLLTSITVSTGGTLKRNYMLTYGDSPTTGAKRLTEVKECADAGPTPGDCLAPTTITYQNGTAGMSTVSPMLSISGATDADGTYDFTGDGIKDMAYQVSGTWYIRPGSTSGYGSAYSTGLSSLRAGKLFGNRRDQLLGVSGGTWYIYDWNGAGFSPTSTGVTVAASAADVVPADVDGDGRDDLVYVTGVDQVPTFGHVAPRIGMAVRRNTSSGSVSFASAVAQSTEFWYLPGVFGSTYEYYASWAWDLSASAAISSYKLSRGGDVNGDGRQELNIEFDYNWCYYSYEYWIYECPGSGTSSQVVWTYNLYPSIAPILDEMYFESNARLTSDDFNKDGCDDFITHFGAVGISNCWGMIVAVSDPQYRGVADYTGDGRKEPIILLGSTLYTQLYWGYTWGAALDTGVPGSYTCELIVTDGNGDGLDDFGCLNPGSSLTIYAHNGTNVMPDLASKFEDGFGVKQEVAYTSLATSTYTPYLTASYPQRDMTGTRAIVQSVSRSDGAGGTFATTYSYYGAVVDLQGRGFQGFDWIDALDSRNYVKYRRSFVRSWPYGGALIGEQWWLGTQLLRLRGPLFAVAPLDTTPNNERHFIYQRGQTETVYDPAGTDPLFTNYTTSTRDTSYGNVTTVTTSVTPYGGSPSSTTIDYTYSPYTSNWCLDLPTSQTTTHQAPGAPNIVQYRTFIPDYANCRISSETFEPSSSTLKVATSYDFDDFGNVDWISVTGRQLGTSVWEDMTARTTQYSYGTTGQFPVSETNPLGQPTTRTFHPTFGSLLTETDPNGIVVANNTYDSFGRISTQTAPDGTYAVYVYGWLSSCCNPRAVDYVGVTRYASNHSVIRGGSVHRDIFGRVQDEYEDSATGSGFTKLSRTYDAFGRVASEGAPFQVFWGGAETPLFTTTYTYDLLGRLLTQSRPQSESVSTPVTTTIAYSGLTQTVTDPQGKQSIKATDASGRLLYSADHDGYAQNFSYDALGNLLEVTDFDPTTSSVNTLFEATYSYGIKPFQIATTDMDLGSWSYTYNSLGELVAWSDANTNTFSQSYDALSRVVSRVEPEGTTTFAWGAHAPSHDIGRLYSVSMPGYAEYNYYDSSGRLVTREEHTDQNYTFDYTYNSQGLLDTVTYPTSTASTRVKVKYGYAYGILQSVTDWTSGSAGTVYWTANSRNVRGQTTQETLGNGVVTTRAFDAVTGWLSSLRSGPNPSTHTLQNLSYAYDLLGNVTQRQESTIGRSENFYYDNLYRLQYSTLDSGSTATNLYLTYDAMGNITSRSDVNGGATWTYHGTKEHAVTSTGTGGTAYSYDANGNMTTRGTGNTLTWASYNYPTQLTTPTETTNFSYGPDRQYYKQDYAGPGGETTYYVGGLLEKVVTGGGTDWRHYIQAEGQTVAIVSRTTSGNAVYYPLEDNQGSGSTLTDASGTNLVRQSYNAFGLPRDGADWDGAVSGGDQAVINGISRRGYTSHSMLGNMGLIHMNGRVQDAVTGRFLSPDPYVFQPGFTQGFNRYAYVSNNPLTMVDPTGFETQCVSKLPIHSTILTTVLDIGMSDGMFTGGVANPWAMGLTRDGWELMFDCKDVPSVEASANPPAEYQPPTQQTQTQPPQGDESLREKLCRAPPKTFNFEVSGKAAVLFGVMAKLQIGVTSHGQFFGYAGFGGSMGVQFGASVGGSVGGGRARRDLPEGLALASPSFVAYGEFTPGIGGGGEVSVDLDGGAAGVSVDAGVHVGAFAGAGGAILGGGTLASAPLLCN